MGKIRKYILDTLGADIQYIQIPVQLAGKLPLFIKGIYKLYYCTLLGRNLLIAEFTNDNEITTSQIEKHIQTIKEVVHCNVILVIQQIPAFNRLRLIEKGINFIVPGKQMYLPALLIDIKDTYDKPKARKEKLLPSAQSILLFYILHRNEKIEEEPLNQIARRFNYTAMAITKAVENLINFNLCKIEGTKEKFIHFSTNIPELWKIAYPLLVNPVFKRVFMDKLPKNKKLYMSNESALPKYSDMNESRQIYFAIDRGNFNALKKNSRLPDLNDYEGKYCLEVWKYSPVVLAENIVEPFYVDPLSLYLSLKSYQDERIQNALEKIINQYIW